MLEIRVTDMCNHSENKGERKKRGNKWGIWLKLNARIEYIIQNDRLVKLAASKCSLKSPPT